MSSSALIVVNENGVASSSERMSELERMQHLAQTTTSAEEAREIMMKGRILSELLQKAKEPYEQAWAAGKASVLAGRRLGNILEEASPKPRKRLTAGSGPGKSERHELRTSLGIGVTAGSQLVALARIPDPDFQRFIQRKDKIPSVNGAFVHLGYLSHKRLAHDRRDKGAMAKRKKKLGLREVSNPSLDKAHTSILRALENLESLRTRGGPGSRGHAVNAAMNSLYVAEDALRPFLGGYAA